MTLTKIKSEIKWVLLMKGRITITETLRFLPDRLNFREKKELNREEFEEAIKSLIEEGMVILEENVYIKMK